MTPEQIDLLKRLQPVFKEKMGEWQKADMFLHGNRGGFVDSIGSEVMRLRLVWNGLDSGARLIYKPYWHELLRIPKPIDPQNPERGLWGMLKGFKDLSSDSKGESWVKLYNQKVNCADPFTALLKALAEQEGV